MEERNKSSSDKPYAKFELGVTPNSSPPKKIKGLKSGYRLDPLSGLPVCVALDILGRMGPTTLTFICGISLIGPGTVEKRAGN